MNLKKSLQTKRSQIGQTIIEYSVLFVILAAVLLVVFGTFNPGRNHGLFGAFDNAVEGAVTLIKE